MSALNCFTIRILSDSKTGTQFKTLAYSVNYFSSFKFFERRNYVVEIWAVDSVNNLLLYRDRA